MMAFFDSSGKEIDPNELAKAMLGRTTEKANYRKEDEKKNDIKKIISSLVTELSKVFDSKKIESQISDVATMTKQLLALYRRSGKQETKSDKSIKNSEKWAEKLYKASQSKHSLHMTINGMEPHAEAQLAKTIAEAVKNSGGTASIGPGYNKMLLQQMKQMTMDAAKYKAVSGLSRLTSGVLGGGVILSVESMQSSFMDMVKAEEEFRVGMKDIIYATNEVAAQTEALKDSYLTLDNIQRRTGHSRIIALKIQNQEMTKGFLISKKSYLTERERTEQARDFESSLLSSLSASKQLGINAEDTADYFSRMRREMGWTAVQSMQLARDMKLVATSSGLFGANLMDALKRSDAIIKALRNSGNLTNQTMRNVVSVMASAAKYGVDDIAEPLLKATSSLKEWIDATPETKSALAQIFGFNQQELEKVIMGNYGKNKEGYKTMGSRLEVRATDLLRQTLMASGRELQKAGAQFNAATGKIRTKGGKEIEATIENFDAIMQALPEAAQIANRNIFSSLKMEAGQAQRLVQSIQESTMSTGEKIAKIEEERNAARLAGAKDLSQFDSRIKDLKINELLSGVTSTVEGFKSGTFAESINRAFGDNAGFQKAMQEGFKPFMEKAESVLGSSGLRKIADPNELKRMLESGNEAQVTAASKILGQIAETVSREEKARTDPMYRIEDYLKNIQEIIGKNLAPLLGSYTAKMVAWGLGVGTTLLSLGSIAFNVAKIANLAMGRMPRSHLGSIGLNPNDSKALNMTENWLKRLFIASQSNHSLHVSLNEFSNRAMRQLRFASDGGRNLSVREKRALYGNRRSGGGGLAEDFESPRGRRFSRDQVLERYNRRHNRRGGGGFVSRVGGGLLDLAQSWGPELLMGYLASGMFSGGGGGGEEGGKETGFFGNLFNQAAGFGIGALSTFGVRKLLGKGLAGGIFGDLAGNVAMSRFAPSADYDNITGTLFDVGLDAWNMRSAMGSQAAGSGGGIISKSFGVIMKPFKFAGDKLLKAAQLLNVKILPKMNIFSNIGSKIMPFIGGSAKLVSRLAGPLALLTGGVSGMFGAGKEGMGLLEGGVLGLLTGGAGRGSSLSGALGVRKGSNTDELLGAYGSMAYGATVGGTVGGPLGAAVGAAAGAGAEIYKISRSANKVVEELQKDLSKTSARQASYNANSMDQLKQMPNNQDKLTEVQSKLEIARNRLEGAKKIAETEKQNLLENSGIMSYIPGMKSGYNAAKASYDAAMSDLQNQEQFVQQLASEANTIEQSLATALKEKKAVEDSKKSSMSNLGAFENGASKEALAESINTNLKEKEEGYGVKLLGLLTEIKDAVLKLTNGLVGTVKENLTVQETKDTSSALNNAVAQMEKETQFRKEISTQNLGLFESLGGEALKPEYSSSTKILSMTSNLQEFLANARGGKEVFKNINTTGATPIFSKMLYENSDSNIINKLVSDYHTSIGREEIGKTEAITRLIESLGSTVSEISQVTGESNKAIVTTKSLPGVDLEETIQRDREVSQTKSSVMAANLEVLNDYFLNTQKDLLIDMRDHLAGIEEAMTYKGSKSAGNVFNSRVDLKSLPMAAHSPDFAEYGYSQAEGGASKNPMIGVI